MNELKLNETPVRTSRNYNINNIKIKDIDIPNSITEFQGTSITGIDENIIVEETVSSYKLKYGLGEALTNTVIDKANKRLRMEIRGKERHYIEVDNVFDENNQNLIENIEIIAEEGTESSVILKYKSKEDLRCYRNGIIRVVANKNARLNLTIINLLSTVSNDFLSIESNIEDNAEINYVIVDFGGKNSIINYYSNLARNKVKK